MWAPDNAFVGKRRYETDAEFETALAEERIKRMRIGGGNPWCAHASFVLYDCLSSPAASACAQLAD